MHEFSLGPIVIVLLVSVITVICCRKFNIPSMLGYLLVGFYCRSGYVQTDSAKPRYRLFGRNRHCVLDVQHRSRILPAQLKAMRRLVFGLGGLQVIITMLSIMGILMAMGTPFNWRLPLRAH